VDAGVVQDGVSEGLALQTADPGPKVAVVAMAAAVVLAVVRPEAALSGLVGSARSTRRGILLP
jgi:hypothetical protein